MISVDSRTRREKSTRPILTSGKLRPFFPFVWVLEGRAAGQAAFRLTWACRAARIS
jgi:hypothetical protein